MSSLVHDHRDQPTPLEEASRTVIERCAALGLAALSREHDLCSHAAYREILRTPAWVDRVEYALQGEPIARVSPGLAVLRIRLSYRHFEPATVDVFAFEDSASFDLGDAAPTPPALPRVSLDDLRRLSTPLTWCAEDAVRCAEASLDIDDLAEQLADSYETLDLLYTLGRSMTDLGRPEQFIRQACQSLRDTIGFGYVAVHVPESENVGDNLSGQTLWCGDPGGPEQRHTLDRLVAVMARLGEVSDAFRGPQALVRPLKSDRGVAGLIVAGDKHRDGGNISSYDTKLIDAAGGFLSTFLTNSRLYAEQRRLVIGVLEALSAAIDAKDPYTQGHSHRVAWLSQHIALALGFDEDAAERLRIAGMLHDVGKIGVPESVLRKAGRLTDDEFDEIKKHPEIGYRILKDLAGLEDVLPAVLHHHERPDGRGYPHGLTEDQIPLVAKIVACADTFDAMSSTRSYRQKMPRQEVLSEIHRSVGSQLDARVVDAFMTINLSPFDELLASAAPPVPVRDVSGDAEAA